MARSETAFEMPMLGSQHCESFSRRPGHAEAEQTGEIFPPRCPQWAWTRGAWWAIRRTRLHGDGQSNQGASEQQEQLLWLVEIKDP